MLFPSLLAIQCTGNEASERKHKLGISAHAQSLLYSSFSLHANFANVDHIKMLTKKCWTLSDIICCWPQQNIDHNNVKWKRAGDAKD